MCRRESDLGAQILKSVCSITSLFVSASLLTSCSTSTSEKRGIAIETQSVVADYPFISSETPDCFSMVQGFCQTLFSSENQGNFLLKADSEQYEIRMGQTQNDFDQNDYEYLKTKLRSWPKLPSEFKEILSAQNFKEKLRAYLSRNSRIKMNIKDRIANMRAEEEIDSIWNLAFKETVLMKMEKTYPGFSQIKEAFIPLELQLVAQREGRVLLSKIAQSLWADHPNWKKVERKFEKVRKAYELVIKEHRSLSPELKQEWLSRINSVKLIIPGSDPEIDMDACLKNESNAYYFTNKNQITVCAGDFNSEDIEQTLAHELGHVLDLNRSRYLFWNATQVGKNMTELKAMSCKKATFSCEKWKDLKQDLQTAALQASSFHPELEGFNSCLQNKSLTSPIPSDYIGRIAKEETDSTLAALAERNVFLRIISQKIPLPDSSSEKNPMYLNPCGYYLWDTQAHPLDEDASLLFFFTAEYRCSSESKSDDKFKIALESAKSLQMALTNSEIQSEGKFSERERLYADGYALASSEKFADAVGQMVFAKLLSDEPSLKRRRAKYLANNAWLCRRPSIQQLFPNEARIQKSYYGEPHSETGQRQKELLTTEIQAILKCKSDFKLNTCPIDESVNSKIN